jgi:uncharacterized protein YuzE
MRVTYDRQADAAYVYLVDIPPGGVADTYPCDPRDELVAGIHLDFDASRRLVGIEVLGAHATLPKEVLQRAEQPSS